MNADGLALAKTAKCAKKGGRMTEGRGRPVVQLLGLCPGSDSSIFDATLANDSVIPAQAGIQPTLEVRLQWMRKCTPN